LLLVSLAPERVRWRTSLQAAGDWMLALGVVAAFVAVAAGLQAYYTVAHDGPSHAAMTDHRNFAFASVALVGAFAVWRYATKSSAPSKLFAVLFFAATLLPATTAWKGGRLVYHHGLGVASLPTVTGEGHDHEHAPGQEHVGTAKTSESDDYDDSDGHHDSDTEDGAENAEHDNSDGHHDDDAGMSTPTRAVEAGSPEAVVNAYGAALRAKDEAALRALLAPDVIIAEGGAAERSVEEYAGHHMPADMAFTAAVEFSLKKRDVIENADLATVVSESQVHGTYNGENVHSRMMETMVLRRENDRWRIVHIHWSSAPITGEHEH